MYNNSGLSSLAGYGPTNWILTGIPNYLEYSKIVETMLVQSFQSFTDEHIIRLSNKMLRESIKSSVKVSFLFFKDVGLEFRWKELDVDQEI